MLGQYESLVMLHSLSQSPLGLFIGGSLELDPNVCNEGFIGLDGIFMLTMST